MATIEERIEALEKKLKQEKARKAQIESRKRIATAKIERQKDTRKKILVGAVILTKVERGEWQKEDLWAILDASLTRDDDRALFGLSSSASNPAISAG